jgi:hypothetical protein
MSAVLQKLRSAPLGTLLLLAIAAGLYVAMLANTVPPGGGGEAIMGQAFAALFLTLWLWIVLGLLLLVGGMMGQMPRWVAISAIFLHPLSGVAAFVAIDALSRHVDGAIVSPVLLPPLIAGYSVWARLPQLHSAFPARAVSVAAWSAILFLSIISLLLAM